MMLNRLAVTKLLITFSMAGAGFVSAAFASLAQQPGADRRRRLWRRRARAPDG